MSIIQLLFYNNPTSLEVTGGRKYTPGNGYVYHVFLEPGSFDVLNGPITAEMLLVAGGGSGGYSSFYSTGGGGAGGVQNITSIPVGDGYYPVVVGSGGLSPGTVRSAGSPSSALGYQSIGGGRGNDSSSEITPDNIGGSGGGNSAEPPSGSRSVPASGISGQGNPGGIAIGPSASGAGGGGGGRGSAGSNASNSVTPPGYQGGAGGNGSPFPAYAAPLFLDPPYMPSSWVTAVGPTGLYGGGGGGGSGPNPTGAQQTPASGGLGGGGRGYTYRPTTPPNLVASPSLPGIDYTGGGGGGGRESNLRSGGTGIVIIRYPE